MSWNILKRKFPSAIAALAAAGLLLNAGSQRAMADDYPAKPVTIVLSYAPGGVADISTRLIAEQMGAKLGQQFIVENKPGGGGILGIQTALNSAADGYTLMLVGNGQAIAKSLFTQLPFDPEADFQPISMFAEFGLVQFTSANSQFKSVKDVLDYAKANPGKLNIGTINTGSTQNLSAELFMSVAGIEASLIPFKGTPDLVTAVIRGDVDVGFEIFAGLKSALDANQIVALATTGTKRATNLPDVPTIEEAGVKPYSVTSWNALAAPVGVPAEAVDRLSKTVAEVLSDPAITTRMLEFGMEARSTTPDETAARMSADVAMWREVIETANVPKQ